MIKQLFMNHLHDLKHYCALCDSWKRDFSFFHHAKGTQNLPVKPPEWELDSVKGAIFECLLKSDGETLMCSLASLIRLSLALSPSLRTSRCADWERIDSLEVGANLQVESRDVI